MFIDPLGVEGTSPNMTLYSVLKSSQPHRWYREISQNPTQHEKQEFPGSQILDEGQGISVLDDWGGMNRRCDVCAAFLRAIILRGVRGGTPKETEQHIHTLTDLRVGLVSSGNRCVGWVRREPRKQGREWMQTRRAERAEWRVWYAKTCFDFILRIKGTSKA